MTQNLRETNSSQGQKSTYSRPTTNASGSDRSTADEKQNSHANASTKSAEGSGNPQVNGQAMSEPSWTWQVKQTRPATTYQEMGDGNGTGDKKGLESAGDG